MSKLKDLIIGGITATVDAENGIITFRAGMTIDGDGGRYIYGPNGKGRDDIRNAMTKSGHYVGLVTVNGVPYLRPDGYYVSTTSYQRADKTVCDPARYLDSEVVPFIALPPQLIKAVPQVVLGSRVMVRRIDGRKLRPAVMAGVGDVGPTDHLGEGSEALAKLLGIDPDPRTGGIETRVVEYEVHAGCPFTFNGETFKLQPYGV